MDLTIPEVTEVAERYMGAITPSFRPENKNRAEELELLKSVECQTERTIDSSIDEDVLEALGQLYRGDYYDFYVMKMVSCIIVSLYEGNKVTALMKIHEWLKNLAPQNYGNFGITMGATLGSFIQDRVTIKYPTEGDLTHEVFVGMAGTNSLRRYIPNYVFVYGGFSCTTGPVIYEGEVYDFCNNIREGTPINYALIEEVSPPHRLEETLGTVTPGLFLDWYLQAILAIQFAHERIGFTHFDLHGGNVLIRKAPPHLIRYPLKKGGLTIRTDTIVTFIDYGLSSFVYEGKRYAVPNLGYLGEVDSFPLYDAYRILASSYEGARRQNNSPLSILIEDIAGYFTRENPDKFFRASGQFHVLPPRLAGLNLYGLIDYIVSFGPTSLVSSPGGVETGYKGISEVASVIGLPGFKRPFDIIELYVGVESLKGTRFLPHYLKILPEGEIKRFQEGLEAFFRDWLKSVEAIPPHTRIQDEKYILEAVAQYQQIAYEVYALKGLSPLFPGEIDTKALYAMDQDLGLYEEYLATRATLLKEMLEDEYNFLEITEPDARKIEKALLRLRIGYLSEMSPGKGTL